MNQDTVKEPIITPTVVDTTSTIHPAMRTVSNMTDDEFKKRVAEFEAKRKTQQIEAQKSSNCPVCQARKNREQVLHRFNDDIMHTFRDVSIVSLDSCILCVQKHVSRAMVYYEEMLTAGGSGTADGTAAVNVKINHLKVLGHLGCAIEESDEYAELHDLLIQTERAYRYEALGPNWQKIAEKITEVEKSMTKTSSEDTHSDMHKPISNTPSVIKVI